MAGTRIAAAGFGDRVDIFEGDATAPVFASHVRSRCVDAGHRVPRRAGRCTRSAAAWNEHLLDPYVPRSLAPRPREAGFEVREIRIVPILNTEYTATTFSYNIAPLIAAFEPGAT